MATATTKKILKQMGHGDAAILADTLVLDERYVKNRMVCAFPRIPAFFVLP